MPASEGRRLDFLMNWHKTSFLFCFLLLKNYESFNLVTLNFQPLDIACWRFSNTLVTLVQNDSRLNVYKNVTTILTFINSLIIEQSARYIISYKILFIIWSKKQCYWRRLLVIKQTNHNKNKFVSWKYNAGRLNSICVML